MIHILNSTAMPREGHYSITEITAEVFFGMIESRAADLVSHIGYPGNLALIERESGISLPLLRAGDEFPEVSSGDQLLMMVLAGGIVRGRDLEVDDFLYYYCTYYES